MSGGLEGLLLVDKPSGPTSHDIVARVRRSSGTRRVGHAGTLDPLASGLLPLVLGKATRLVRFLPHSPKRYSGTMQLGVTSPTDDVTGELTRISDGPWPDSRTVHEAARSFLGRGLQVPPAVSARKVAGRRLYRFARAGVAVSAPPAPIEVLRFEIEPTEAPDRLAFLVEVSAGTYVRGLLRDIGRLLGCGAVLEDLRRTRIGPLRVEDAVSLTPGADERLGTRVLPLDSMPLEAPSVTLSDELAERDFCSGRAVEIDPTITGTLQVRSSTGRLLGIAEVESNRLRPRVVLCAPLVAGPGGL